MTKYNSQADAIEHLVKEGALKHKDLVTHGIWVICPKCTRNIKMYASPVCQCGTDVENPPYKEAIVGDIVRHKPTNRLYRIHQLQHHIIWGSEVNKSVESWGVYEFTAYREPETLHFLTRKDLVKVTNIKVDLD